MIKYSQIIKDAEALKKLCLNQDKCEDCPEHCTCDEWSIGTPPSIVDIENLIEEYLLRNMLALKYKLIISRNDALLPAENWHPIHTEVFDDFTSLLSAVNHTRAYISWLEDKKDISITGNCIIDGGVKYEYEILVERFGEI